MLLEADAGMRVRAFNGLSAASAAAAVDRSSIGKVDAALLHQWKVLRVGFGLLNLTR